MQKLDVVLAVMASTGLDFKSAMARVEMAEKAVLHEAANDSAVAAAIEPPKP